MPKKLYIIDGHAHIYSAYYAPMRLEWPKHPASDATYGWFDFEVSSLGYGFCVEQVVYD